MQRLHTQPAKPANSLVSSNLSCLQHLEDVMDRIAEFMHFHMDWIPLMMTLGLAGGQLLIALLPLLPFVLQAIFSAIV